MDRTKKLHDTTSPFALDPFVAYPNPLADPGRPERPKSIEQILQEINGFQISPNGSSSIAPVRLAAGPQTVAQAPDSNRVESAIGTRPTNNSSRIPVAIVAQPDAQFGETAEENFPVLEFDVRMFEEPAVVPEPLAAPAPIRNAFEFDPDFFDYAAIETRDGNFSHNTFHQPAIVAAKSDGTASDPGVFWAAANDVIFIDGRDGFGLIDVACFEISSASFEANRIRIRVSDDAEFQIEYRNVTHAIFADGVEVELDSKFPESSVK